MGLVDFLEIFFRADNILQGFTLTILTVGVWGIFDIKKQVASINGGMGKIKARLDLHEKIDEERMGLIHDMLKELRTSK